MEAQQDRLRDVQKRSEQLIADIEKAHLRKMQGDMHRCAANCCDNLSYSMERNRHCIEKCSFTVQKAEEYVQTEINRLQNRWSRCIMDCQDRLRDYATPEKSEASLEKDFASCAATCIESQCKLLDIARTNMNKVLTSGKYNEA